MSATAAEATATEVDAVTGAFGYSGSFIAARLLGAGRQVRTLTGHPERAGEAGNTEAGNTEAGNIDVRPLDFDDPAGLTRSLSGVTTLYNTYWVRFAHGAMDHATAVANSTKLFEAARQAGVSKVVHISILNPSAESPYSYFSGKALVEQALIATGLPYAILRPCVLYDERGVLLNNIAWLLRHLPVFAVGGDGSYRVRPIHVDDLAKLAVEAAGWETDRTVDAVGPQQPTFLELVGHIKAAVGSRAVVVKVPGPVVVGAAKVLGTLMKDVLLTSDEYHSMADGLAGSEAPSTGSTDLYQWLHDHASTLGKRYFNELGLHFR